MSRFKTILLLSVAIPGAATGLWALLAPRSWHDGFPGFGRDWVPVFGPFNEHLARDYGSALLGLSALLAISALKPHVRLQRAAAGGFLVFATPHLVFHLVHFGELPLGDDIVSIATLLLSVAIPAAVLLSSGQAPARVPPRGPDGWRLPPAPERGLLARLSYAYSRRRFGHVLGPIALTAHNPILLAGYSTMELALERADRIDRPLEELAATRAATMTGCPFCMDYAGGLLPSLGFSREQVAAVPEWRDSDAFSDAERLVLEYAEAMSSTPVEIDDELFDRLRERFDEPAIVELTAAIALENYRGRFNHALGLGAEGFCELPSNGRPAAVVASS